VAIVREVTEDFGKLKLLIGGQWVDSQTDEWLETFNPAKGNAIGKVPLALREEVGRAVESAQTAYEKWKNVPILERVKYLFKLRDVMLREYEDLATLNTVNHGKTLEESRGDMNRTLENIDSAIAVAYTLAKGETLDEIASGVDEAMVKEPLGVFGIVCPFNFPILIPFWFIPYAIVLGDTIVVKPSEITPVPMQRIADMINTEIGLPPGVFNLVHGARGVVESLISHESVKGVCFVGSSPVAKLVYKLAGEHGKRAIAQGGAKNTVVVMPDAELDRSIPPIVSSFFGNTGQRCLAGANLVGVGAVYNDLMQKLVAASKDLKIGYGLDEETKMGPVVSSKAKERIVSYIESGESEGARLATDGRAVKIADFPEGYYLGPSIFDHVTPDMRIAKEEIFGPVASAMSCRTLDDAMEAISQKTRFGNMACIFTTSGRAAREFRRRVDAGNIGINIGVAAPVANFPLSGRRESFFGILHAQIDTVDFFTDRKVVVSRW
jgi:malonate-semialdehyde dehydrogenase (acetylating)/methylmalonate-semialdehyde dehydrogenase